VEKEGPVDVLAQLRRSARSPSCPRTEAWAARRRKPLPLGPRLCQRQSGAGRLCVRAQLLLEGVVSRSKVSGPLRAGPTPRRSRARRQTWTVVPSYAGAIRTAVCCFEVVATDEQRDAEVGRSSPCDHDHLVERRRDEARIDPPRRRRARSPCPGSCPLAHDTEVNDLVVVHASTTPTISCRLMDIALYRREHELPRTCLSPVASSRLHERL